MAGKNVVSTPTLRSAYQSLLLDDWTEIVFLKTLAILWDEIGTQEEKVPDWWNVLDPNRTNTAETNAFVIERLRHLASVLTHPAIYPMPHTSPMGHDSDAGRLAETAWAYLILQSLAHLEGDVGFFADTQSALFLCCAHYLLPSLKTEAMSDHRTCLLNAMYSHTWLVWRNQPAHMAYLQSVLMDCVGARGERIKLLGDSVTLTPVTDHSFLTKVQGYWSELIDLGDYKAAESFLLNVYRGSLRDDLPELLEMFQVTKMAMIGAYGKA